MEPKHPQSFPSRIGRYHVLGELATGGMAEILLGKLVGPSGFERPVVIKRILPHLARRRSFVEMFLDEAVLGARIRHPNVVQVLDLGRDASELFLVMEYLEGESVASLMRRLARAREPLDYGLLAFIIAEACAGLHAAHELRDDGGTKLHLVHRDISPHNLFVTYDGQIKVLDFGIAKAASRLAHTETGHVKGKFPYMSPEQCRDEDLDARSDIFSMGIVLFELTTLRRLFRDANSLSVLKAITELPIPSPSAYAHGYPTEIEAICLKALQRRPEARFQTAAAMRGALLAQAKGPGPSDARHEQLAALMRRLFAERLEEKRQMLQRVRAGSDVAQLAAFEIDDSIDLPPVEPETTVERIRGPSPRRSRWSLSRTAAVAAGALAASIAVFWLAGEPTGAGPRVDPEQHAPPSPAPPARTPLAPPDGTHSQPAGPITTGDFARAASEVLVRVETTPPGASLYVGEERLATTPGEIRLPRGNQVVVLWVRKDRFLPLRERVVPNIDQRLRLTLTPAPRKNPDKPASTNDGASFHRFE